MQERASPTNASSDQALILVEARTLALVQASRRVREELGYSSSELGGMSLTDIVLYPPPAELRRALSPLEEAVGAEISVAVRLRGRREASVAGELLLIPFTLGEVPLLAAVIRFATARADSADGPALEPGNANFVDFTARLGHDFNNLLSTVIGSLGLIREDSGDGRNDETRQLSEDALSASRECADLVDGLMAAAGNQLLRPQHVALNDVIRRLTQLLTQTLPGNIDLQVSLDPGIPDLNVDPDRLEAAIIGLVVNAREAMPAGGELLISSHLGESPDAGPGADRRCVQVTVSDTGPGIPANLVDRVLEPLFTTKTSGTGRGLGLSIVNGFVQQSRGALGMESTPGRGTRITLSFPPAE